MKLMTLDKNNCAPNTYRNTDNAIRLNRKNGLITLSRSLVRKLGLKDKDRLLFALDEEKQEWYMRVTDDKMGFTIRCNCKPGARFTCRILVDHLLKKIKNIDHVSLLVAQNPIEIDGIEHFRVLASKPLIYKD